MVLTRKSELFSSSFIPPTYCLFRFFFFSFPLSSQSIDTCIQTQRASAIPLVKLDICWTPMVQHTFEMIRSHLFLFLFLSLSFPLYFFFFKLFVFVSFFSFFFSLTPFLSPSFYILLFR
jgi:hypothetical protein